MPNQTPVQIAWVTRDLDRTEQALTTLLGARRWIRMPAVRFGPDTCTHRGRPADFTADVALSYAGDIQLEVIAPVDGESVYTEFLDRCGPGLHHVCLEMPDTEAFDERLRAAPATAPPRCATVSWPAVCASRTCRPRTPVCRIRKSLTSRPRSGRSSIM